MNFVLDTSATLAWVFADEASPETDMLRRSLGRGAKAVVPALWRWEVANVLRQAERAKRLKASEVNQQLSILRQFPITVDADSTLAAWDSTLMLARKHTLTCYDAAYLELALRLGWPLATLDKSLRNAATAEGVVVYPKKR